MIVAKDSALKSIFYSSISLKNSEENLNWDRWKKNEYFTNSKTTSFLVDKIDIREKNIKTQIGFEIPQDFQFSVSEEHVNLFSLDKTGIIFSYHHCGNLKNNSAFFLHEPDLQAYNVIIGDNLNTIEDTVLNQSDLKGKNSVWWYPVMFVPVEELNQNSHEWISENMAFLTDDSVFDPVVYSEAIGFVGWDFAIFFYDKEQEQIIEIIDFYLKITALEYHCLTETSGRITELITDKSLNSRKKIDLFYNIYKDFFQALALLDKNILSYANSDKELLRGLANKWESDAFLERVTEKVDKMNQLYLYEADKIEKEDAEYLNRIVFLIAILGITGTVAGVISTIDATNDTFNASLRTSIIIWSTVLSGLLFGYFLPILFKWFSRKK